MTAISTSNHGSGLSASAIGGIVGGILGTLLLFSVAATFYLLGRRSGAAENQSGREPAMEKSDKIVEPIGNRNDGIITDIDVGGRLRYPNDQIDVGGRLGSSV